MSRSLPELDDVGHYYNGPTLLSGLDGFQQSRAFVANSVYVPPRQSEQYTSGPQDHHYHVAPYSQLLDGRRTAAISSRPSATETGQGAQTLSPNLVSRLALYNHTSPDDGQSETMNSKSQHTAYSGSIKTEEPYDEEGDAGTTGSDGDDDETGAEKSKAERLAEKRKMKRFRLTHAQTRYLMSEFTRQAHPDADQRQKLSREIPGLSPRQVQVWFQNRRAKLKRLSVDDQERMISSRALPKDFNFAQSLQPAHAEQTSPLGCDGSIQKHDLASDTDKSVLEWSQKHRTIHTPTDVVMENNHLSGHGFANPPIVSCTKDGLQHLDRLAQTYPLSTLIDHSNGSVPRPHAQRQVWVPRQKVISSEIDSVVSPTSQPNPQPTLQTHDYNVQASRKRGPHLLPNHLTYHQYPLQYPSAAGSARYSTYTRYLSTEVEIDPWPRGPGEYLNHNEPFEQSPNSLISSPPSVYSDQQVTTPIDVQINQYNASPQARLTLSSELEMQMLYGNPLSRKRGGNHPLHHAGWH